MSVVITKSGDFLKLVGFEPIDVYILIEDMTTKILGLNLPYGLEIPVVDGEGNPIYTFNVNVNSNRPFDVALQVNTEIAVAYINANYANLDGKVNIIGIPTL